MWGGDSRPKFISFKNMNTMSYYVILAIDDLDAAIWHILFSLGHRLVVGRMDVFKVSMDETGFCAQQ